MSFCRTFSQDHKFKSQLILYYERQLVSLSLSLKFCCSDCMLRRLCVKRVWTLKLDRPISVLALTHSLAEGLGYLLNLCKSQISLLSNRNPLALLLRGK